MGTNCDVNFRGPIPSDWESTAPTEPYHDNRRNMCVCDEGTEMASATLALSPGLHTHCPVGFADFVEQNVNAAV